MEKNYFYGDIYDSPECNLVSDIIESCVLDDDIIESCVLDDIISEIDECFEIMWYISNGDASSARCCYTQDIP